MTGLIGALRVTLGADTAQFEKGMKRARGEMAAMQKASAALKTAFVGMAGLLAFDQFASLAKAGLDYASSLGEVAAQLGVSTRALQEYRYAASQAGIEQAEMDKGLTKLSIKIGEAARGNEKAVGLFERLGISIRDANGLVRDTGDIIPEIAEVYKNLESQAEKTALAAEIFGAKLGPKFSALLEGGAEGVNNLRNAANSLGLVLSDKLINDADTAADKMAELKKVLEAKIAVAVSENAGAIIELVNALVKLVEWSAKAARAWRAFSEMDFSSLGGSFASGGIFGAIQNMRMQGEILAAREVKSSVELTPSAAAAIEARKGGLPAPSGGSQIAPRQGAPNPWLKKTPSLLQRRNAAGVSAFGGQGLSSFTPGLGDNGWIKTATKGYADIAARASEAATANAAAKAELAEMAKEHGPRLLASVKALAPAMEELRARAQGILDRLFPDEAEARQFKEELAILDAAMAKGALTTEDHRRSVEALRHEFTGLAEAMRAAVNIETVAGPSIENMVDQIADRAEDALDATRKNADVTRVQVVDSFRDMTEGALREFDRLANSIRSGGFLDILSSVIGFGLQLGSSGLFGKNIQSHINSVPGRAFGGPVMANQPYIVGERRAELFVPSTSGRIEPNPGNGRRGGGDTYHFSGNLLTPEWWAQIQKGFDEAAVRGAMGGADLVASRSQKQARQRLGRSR